MITGVQAYLDAHAAGAEAVAADCQDGAPEAPCGSMLDLASECPHVTGSS